MKGLILIIGLLSFNSVFASAYTRYDSIYFQKHTAWVSASRVCQSNGYLYANIVFENCGGGNGNQCGPVHYEMAQPMNSTTVRCASTGRECTAYKTYPLKQGGVVYKYSYNSQIEISEDLNATVTPYRIRSCN